MIIIVMVIVITTTVATSAILAASGGSGASTSYNTSTSSITSTSTSSLSSTTSTSSLALPQVPQASTYQSCVTDSDLVYCVEGNQTYFATLSSSGIGNWTPTTSYPFESGTCVASGGYIYCVDGQNGSAPSASVYFAQLTSSGIGPWVQTTSYPIADAYGPSCIASASYLYCLGGNSTVTGTNASSLAYFAPISSSGVGSWQEAGTYGYEGSSPVAVLNGPGPYVDLGSGPACVTSSGDAYCVGGAFCYPTIGGPGCVGDRFSFYTSIISAVLVPSVYTSPSTTAWTNTTLYPDLSSMDSGYQDVNNPSCVANSGYIYCVGGGALGNGVNATYFAQLTPSGIGNWTGTSVYPALVASASCVTYSSYIYCINGFPSNPNGDNPVSTSFYAPLSSSGIGRWLPANQF